MTLSVGEKIKLYLETPTGEVFEMTSYLKSLSINRSYNSQTEVNIDLIGIEPGNWSKTSEYREKLKENRSSHEWKCDYCKQVNLRQDLSCQHCGGVRSFVYD